MKSEVCWTENSQGLTPCPGTSMISLADHSLSSESLLSLWGCRNITPSMGFSTEKQQSLLQELALAALTQSTWAVDATGICKAHKQPGAYQGIWWLMQKQSSRDLGQPQHLQTLGSSCSAGCCNLGLWTLLKVQDAFQVLLLPRVHFSTAKQAGSSQHYNFQLTLTWVSTTIPCARQASQPPTSSILPRHQDHSPSTPPHYLVWQGLCGDMPPYASGITAWLSSASSTVLLQPRVARSSWISGFITASSPGLLKRQIFPCLLLFLYLQLQLVGGKPASPRSYWKA